MFPEYRELITQLKTSDAHFVSLFQQHNALDQQVKRMVSRTDPSSPEQIETLKKEKLRLKDEIFALLKKAAQA
ncbi:MAG: YdcH family protein [Rhodoferax sp.]|uniref:YdcH family protein n=1 Tax=Rhodoferax sp. TaxID=50421 RepID=UPI002623BC8B|nr:YdcH family protein [Rhodoferax sp.]MDD2882587.1 YdcH family protein [Rhodoferax sp.]